MAHFPYQPLDISKNEIRLLFPAQQLETERPLVPVEKAPSRNDAIVTPDLTLEFELRTVSLDCKPVYTALSYVWGDRANPKSITVNGYVIPVTKNLGNALQHLQYEDIRPAIWIDAICIDQQNDDEKNYQVPQMGRIYSNARKVLIWLGPGTEETDQSSGALTPGARNIGSGALLFGDGVLHKESQLESLEDEVSTSRAWWV